jgi:Putative peptidoglycan binding domain
MSNTMSPFEMLPFRENTEAEEEETRGRGRTAFARSARQTAGFRTAAMTRHVGSANRLRTAGGDGHQHRGPFGGRVAAWPGVEAAADGAPGQAGPRGSEQVRWVQFMLNGALGTNLPTDGVMTADLRAALRNFQSQQGLPVSGFIGPDTVDALRNAGGPAAPGSSEYEFEGAAVSTGPATAAEAALADTRAAKSIAAALGTLGPTPMPGLYRLFRPDGHFHTGMARDLQRRIKHHVLCASHLGLSLKHWRVTLYPMPNATGPALQAIETAIKRHHEQLGSKMLAKQAEQESLELGLE